MDKCFRQDDMTGLFKTRVHDSHIHNSHSIRRLVRMPPYEHSNYCVRHGPPRSTFFTSPPRVDSPGRIVFRYSAGGLIGGAASFLAPQSPKSYLSRVHFYNIRVHACVRVCVFIEFCARAYKNSSAYRGAGGEVQHTQTQREKSLFRNLRSLLSSRVPANNASRNRNCHVLLCSRTVRRRHGEVVLTSVLTEGED